MCYEPARRAKDAARVVNPKNHPPHEPILDISDPWQVAEMGCYIIEPEKWYELTRTNGVFQSRDVPRCIVDGLWGFEILERKA